MRALTAKKGAESSSLQGYGTLSADKQLPMFRRILLSLLQAEHKHGGSKFRQNVNKYLPVQIPNN
jgi:hypothetical protein